VDDASRATIVVQRLETSLFVVVGSYGSTTVVLIVVVAIVDLVVVPRY
jgi:hypothetical protein